MVANVIPMPAWGASPDDWQHLDLVLGLTEDLLPVVSNAKATISPNSTMKDLGKTPSQYNPARQAVGFPQWTQHITTPEEIARWSKERDYGICIQSRTVRALDIDVPDPDASGRIVDAIAKRVGVLPRRLRSNSGKSLIAFTLCGEFTKRKFKTAGGIVEFLANGQQFIACGTHPSGVRYEWDGGLPDEFPELTPGQFEQLWSDLVAEFAIEDAHTSSSSVKRQKLADVLTNDPVAQHLLATDRVKKAEADGRLHIVCPFEDEHTSESGDTATTYWPAHTGGYANGHFHCLHAHCEHRTDQEYLDAIEYQEASSDEFTAIVDAGAAQPDAADQDPDGPQPITEAPAADGGAQKASRFAVQPAHAFTQGKPTTWMIKGILPRAELAVLFGESGSGKSFLALDMAVAVAQGEAWRGQRTKQGRVVYIAAEGAGGFRKRLQAVAVQQGLDLNQLAIGVISDVPNLMEKTDALDVAKAIVAAGGADLIIVDTWAQTTPGANENSGEDMGRALKHCKGIHRATGAMVMLVHHSGKDSSKGARGWSGLRAAADVELEVVRADEARSVSVTKLKDGEDGAEYGFRLESIVLGLDEDQEEITSCVVVHSDSRVQRAKKGPKGAVEKLVLEQLQDAIGLGDGGVDVNVLMGLVKAQMPQEEGKRDQRSARIHRALDSLRAADRIVVNGVFIGLKS